MAKKFIALEETSQAIKTTVEGIQTDVDTVGTAVNEIKEDVGDGAGTDLVTRVANLEAKIDALASSGGGGGLRRFEADGETVFFENSYADLTFTKDTRMILFYFYSECKGELTVTTNVNRTGNVVTTFTVGVYDYDSKEYHYPINEVEITKTAANYVGYLPLEAGHYYIMGAETSHASTVLNNLKITGDIKKIEGFALTTYIAKS